MLPALLLIITSFSFGQIVINEIHYNPSLSLGFEDSDYEFVELYNDSDEDINLNDWVFTNDLSGHGILYHFDHQTIESGAYLVMCVNSHTYDNCIDWGHNTLSNSHGQIGLLDAHHNVIDQVMYGDGNAHLGFPGEPDAGGPSLELLSPDLDNNNGENWQASTIINGTPGYQNSNGDSNEISNIIEFGAWCDGNLEILYKSDEDISGFQFNLSGFEIESAFGGAAEDAGFSVSNSELVVVGFSLEGNIIPAGEGVLTNLSVNSVNPTISCIEDIIISDPEGNQIQFIAGDCVDYSSDSWTSEECDYCDDELACNFGLNGACEYSTDNFDCDGNCIVETDCLGICGGSSVVDECGVCDGSGAIYECGCSNISEGSCDCEGNVEDCAGNCGGTAEFDECGVCGGSGPEENFDCDGNCLVDVDCAGECNGSAELDECGVCNGSGIDEEACDCDGNILDECGVCGGSGPEENFDCDGNCIAEECELETQYFTDLPPATGESQLVIIEDIVGEDIEIGDEIGIYDMNGLVELCNPEDGCTDPQFGPVLVGSAVWDGTQTEVSCNISVNLLDFNGPALEGAVLGNDIVFIFWDSSENVELMVNSNFTTGEGVWGDVFTVATLETINFVTLDLTLNANMFNSASFNIDIDLSIFELLGDAPLLMSDDNGSFYVPSFDIDELGDFENEGYYCYISGFEDLTISIDGAPIDQTTPLLLEPFKANMLPYLPQYEMSSDEVFGEYYDEILFISNDMGQFIVPDFGVFQITTMYPGEAYSVVLSGSENLEFSYPEFSTSARNNTNNNNRLYEQSKSDYYEIVNTGVSYPIVITSILGSVEAGDEIVAYANDEVVGATKILDPNNPILISASKGFNSYDIDLPGYTVGDEIKLKLLKQVNGKEIDIDSNLDNDFYGLGTITLGTITINESTMYPNKYSLSQNYPNPFNPNTTIDYSLSESGNISVSIYDVSGRLVKTLANGFIDSGNHSLVWNGKDNQEQIVSAGLYICKLKGDGFEINRKMIMMK